MPSALARSRAARLAAEQRNPTSSPPKRARIEESPPSPSPPREEPPAVIRVEWGLDDVLRVCDEACVRMGWNPPKSNVVSIKTSGGGELGELSTVKRWLGACLVRSVGDDGKLQDFAETCINLNRTAVLIDVTPLELEMVRELLSRTPSLRVAILSPDVFEREMSGLRALGPRLKMPPLSEGVRTKCLRTAFRMWGINGHYSIDPFKHIEDPAAAIVTAHAELIAFRQLVPRALSADHRLCAREAVEQRADDGKVDTREAEDYARVVVPSLPTIEACSRALDLLANNIPDPEAGWLAVHAVPSGPRRDSLFFNELRERSERNVKHREVRSTGIFTEERLMRDPEAVVTEASQHSRWLDRGWITGNRFVKVPPPPLVFEREETNAMPLDHAREILKRALRESDKKDVAKVRQRVRGWQCPTPTPDDPTCPRSVGEWFGVVTTPLWRKTWTAITEANISTDVWADTLRRLTQ